MPKKAVRLQGRDLSTIVNLGENDIIPETLKAYLCLEASHIQAILYLLRPQSFSLLNGKLKLTARVP